MRPPRALAVSTTVLQTIPLSTLMVTEQSAQTLGYTRWVHFQQCINWKQKL